MVLVALALLLKIKKELVNLHLNIHKFFTIFLVGALLHLICNQAVYASTVVEYRGGYKNSCLKDETAYEIFEESGCGSSFSLGLAGGVNIWGDDYKDYSLNHSSNEWDYLSKWANWVY